MENTSILDRVPCEISGMRQEPRVVESPNPVREATLNGTMVLLTHGSNLIRHGL
ncbi:MAG: hypothetical protein RLZ25_1305 [Pseudomonadota bacterium]|jgi:hypothetical protein